MMSQKDNQEHLSYDGLKTWYEAMLARYTAINEGSTSIDNKMLGLMGASIAVLVFVATFVDVDYLNVLLLLGCGGLMGSIIFAIVGTRVKDTSSPVHTEGERPDYYNKTDEQFIWQLVADIEDSITKITKTNIDKAGWYNRALYCFIISGFMVVFSNFIDICLH